MLLVSNGNRLLVNNLHICINRIEILCPTLQSSRKKIRGQSDRQTQKWSETNPVLKNDFFCSEKREFSLKNNQSGRALRRYSNDEAKASSTGINSTTLNFSAKFMQPVLNIFGQFLNKFG